MKKSDIKQIVKDCVLSVLNEEIVNVKKQPPKSLSMVPHARKLISKKSGKNT